MAGRLRLTPCLENQKYHSGLDVVQYGQRFEHLLIRPSGGIRDVDATATLQFESDSVSVPPGALSTTFGAARRDEGSCAFNNERLHH